MMSSIRGSNTRPEVIVRSYLHRAGLRFRLHVNDLPGRPDLVFPQFRVALFVHGCFWHRHKACRFTTTPGTRPEFWQEKFRKNVARDRRAAALLRSGGWRVFTIWECEVDNEEVLDRLFFCITAGIDC